MKPRNAIVFEIRWRSIGVYLKKAEPIAFPFLNVAERIAYADMWEFMKETPEPFNESVLTGNIAYRVEQAIENG